MSGAAAICSGADSGVPPRSMAEYEMRTPRRSTSTRWGGSLRTDDMLSFIRAECLATFQLHFRKKLAESCPIAALSVSIRTGRGFLEDHGKA